MNSNEQLSNRDFWQDKWMRNPTAQPKWDLEGAHPLFDDLYQLIKETGFVKTGADVFVPGCGRSHNGAKFAKLGFKVLAMDIVPEAIKRAKELYGDEPNLSLELGSVFDINEKSRHSCDLVFDRAMLCALDEQRRPAFVEAMSKRLRPGGVFASIGFSKTGEQVGGPPFAIDMDKLTALFEAEFTLVSAEHRQDGSCDEVIVEEIINIWRRKQ